MKIYSILTVAAYFSARKYKITISSHSILASSDFSAGHSETTVIIYSHGIIVILISANERTALQVECGTILDFNAGYIKTMLTVSVIAALYFAIRAAVRNCQRSGYYDDRAVIISTRQPTVNGVSIEVYRSRHAFGHIDIASGVHINRQRVGVAVDQRVFAVG